MSFCGGTARGVCVAGEKRETTALSLTRSSGGLYNLVPSFIRGYVIPPSLSSPFSCFSFQKYVMILRKSDKVVVCEASYTRSLQIIHFGVGVIYENKLSFVKL